MNTPQQATTVLPAKNRVGRGIAIAALLLVAGCGKVQLYSNLQEREANEMMALLLNRGVPCSKALGEAHAPSHSNASASSTTSIGDSIINTLAGVKRRGEEMKAEMAAALSDSNPSSGEMLAIQYKLMGMSIELQTTSNMAHHGVEDVKTIMRGQ